MNTSVLVGVPAASSWGHLPEQQFLLLARSSSAWRSFRPTGEETQARGAGGTRPRLTPRVNGPGSGSSERTSPGVFSPFVCFWGGGGRGGMAGYVPATPKATKLAAHPGVSRASVGPVAGSRDSVIPFVCVSDTGPTGRLIPRAALPGGLCPAALSLS